MKLNNWRVLFVASAALVAIFNTTAPAQELFAGVQGVSNSKQDVVLPPSGEQESQMPATSGDSIKTTPDTLLTPPPNTLEQDLVGIKLLDSSFPGSWPIPGTKARIGIFGFVKADYLQDIRLNPNIHEFTISTIPMEGTPQANHGGRAFLHAVSSRFVLVVRSITDKGMPLQAMISFDMGWDDPAFQNLLRLRMAYIVVGNFLAGQTWSTFADLTQLIYTLDFEGGDALIGDRVAQFRYTSHFADTWSWAAAIEQPRQKINNIAGLDGVGQQQTPEFVGRIRWEKGRSHVQLTGLVNQLRFAYDDGSDATTAIKYGGNFTGLFVFGGGETEMVSAGIAGGKGIASWSPSTGDPLDAVLTVDRELDVLPFLEYNFFYRHNWAKKWSSLITWAYAKVWLDDRLDDKIFSEGGAFHLHLLWYPSTQLLAGIEYIWGFKETKDGSRGVADRIQFAVKWQFNP